MSGLSGWLISVGVPLACMGAAYVFTTARKNIHNSQNSQSSLDLSTGNSLEDSKKRKLEKKKRQKEQREAALKNVSQNSNTSSRMISSDSGESEDEAAPISENDMVQLAFLKKLANTSSSSNLSSSSSLNTLAPSDSSVIMQPISEDNIPQDDKSWARVPTRNEEIITSLKHRIASLTEQMEASNIAQSDLQKELNSSNRKNQSLELDIKEKTKAFSHQLNQLEGQLNGKSIELAAATEQLKNLASLSSELKIFQDKLTQIQEELECSQKEIENMSHIQHSLIQERDSVKSERDIYKSERDLLKSQVSTLQRQLVEAQKTNELNINEFSTLKKSTELELISNANQISSLNEQLNSLKNEFDLKEKESTEQSETFESELIILRTKCEALERDIAVSERELLVKSSQPPKIEYITRVEQCTENVIPSEFYHYMEGVLSGQSSFKVEKSNLLAQIIDLKRKIDN
jgi:DNA repair exonuclease SbcCD ATPase subunit